jgi:hypothetical protein
VSEHLSVAALVAVVQSKFEDILGEDACWEWPLQRLESGYGVVAIPRAIRLNRSSELASRVVLAAKLGLEFMDELERNACHTCDNPPCCNPCHLWEGTHKQNSEDMVAKGRQQRWRAEQTQCNKGHEFTPDNTLTQRGGAGRLCRLCRQESNRRADAKRQGTENRKRQQREAYERRKLSKAG